MKTIKLTRGYEAIVDDDKYDELMKFKWLYAGRDGQGYAARRKRVPGNRTKINMIYMHKVVFDNNSSEVVDHVNRNKLDNRMENLRAATYVQNSCNRGKPKNNKSGYKGVSKIKSTNRWLAQIKHKDKMIYLGRFKNKEEAAITYDFANVLFNREFASLDNFNQITG